MPALRLPMARDMEWQRQRAPRRTTGPSIQANTNGFSCQCAPTCSRKPRHAAGGEALPVVPFAQWLRASLVSRPLCALRIILLCQLSAAFAETCHADHSHLVRCEAQRRRQNAESILHAALEIDRRCFLKVFRRA